MLIAAGLLRARPHTALSGLLLLTGIVIAAGTPKPSGRRWDKPAETGRLAGLRAKAAERIDRTFRDDAPLARALLIADQKQIPPAIRDTFAASGLVHMLSISGLHVAIIAAAMELLFQAARLPRREAQAAALLATAMYVALIGAPAPALRSAVMLGTAMISRLAQRPTSPWASLALGAFAPLFNPRTMLDLGYQLSVLGMAALIAGGTLARRLTGGRLAGWKVRVARDLLISITACVVTAPLVSWTFGRLSIVAPLANLVAGPVIAVAQPMLFLALALSAFGGAGRFFADAVHPLLEAFVAIASFGASLPGAVVSVAPGLLTALLACLVAGSVIVACVSRFPSGPALVAAGAVAAMVVVPDLKLHRGEVEMHVLDVGQGDAILLRTDRGNWILVDAGPAWKGGDAGRSTVLPYLQRRGGALRAFILSHPHTDHVGGARTVLDALRPPVYWDAGFAGGSDAYIASLNATGERQIRWARVHPGDSLRIDGLHFGFLAPDSTWTAGLTDPNLASTIAMVRFGAVRFLLVGDAEVEEEDWLVARYGEELMADVLKVAHHGSSTSTSKPFIRAVRPRVAVISVGDRNRYGHPSREVMEDLMRAGAAVMRTDQSGTVVVRTNGKDIEIDSEGQRWRLPARSYAR
ncbi:MAG: DNA internalization-related competence protein ComEC/Rec2 [Gemmatimonadaceae bacterium]|nr:DNA internalization-related competence protein ComEC/Rec2 [Gemmatimonadaceae bacterium]